MAAGLWSHAAASAAGFLGSESARDWSGSTAETTLRVVVAPNATTTSGGNSPGLEGRIRLAMAWASWCVAGSWFRFSRDSQL
jgi:hypothetical protein